MPPQKLDYAFTLKGDGIDFAGHVNRSTARSLLDVVLGRTSNPPRDPQAVKGQIRDVPKQSVREFLNDHGAKRIPEKIAAIGEYITAHGATDFSKDEVLTQFRVAREVMPANFRRDFSWAIATGWIAEDPDHPGRFYITQSGKQAVGGSFSSDVTKNSGFRSVRRRRRRS